MKGPFGDYAHGSMGGVLNTLVQIYRVPLMLAERVTVGWCTDRGYTDVGEIHDGDKLVARFRWFEGIEHAVMMFCDPAWRVYGQQNQWVIQDGDRLKPNFKITLNGHFCAAFEIEGGMATPKLHSFLGYPMLTNFMDHPCYRLAKESGAFFQGGSDNPKGNWFMIEFWKPEGVKAWMDYLNENYIHDPKEELDTVL